MPSYAIIGASRGIGLEFVRQLAKEKENQVFAVVRNPHTSQLLADLVESSTHKNMQVVKGDLADVDSLKAAATEIAHATGGLLDYLINNAVYVNAENAGLTMTDYPDEKALEDDLVTSFRTNVVGVTHTINVFLPLLRNATTRKVITLSSGLADTDMILRSGFCTNVPYAVAKAALNMVVAEFAARFRDENFTFLAISPGLVNTAVKPATPEELAGFKQMVVQFKKYAPEWDGVPLTPSTSVKMMREVIDEVEPKDSGAFISQFGNKKWL